MADEVVNQTFVLLNHLFFKPQTVRHNYKQRFMTKNIIILLVVLQQFLFVQSQTKIIDMHIHSYTDSDFGEREPTSDYYGKKGSSNAEMHRLETFAAFKKWNVVKAVVSGNPESVENWAANDSNHRIIRGIFIFSPDDYGMDSVKFEQLIKDKKIEVFRSITTLEPVLLILNSRLKRFYPAAVVKKN